MSHTPGPWWLGKHGAVHGGPFVECFNGSAQPQVALATMHEEIKPEQRDANARLIAAAPELLAACRKVKEYLGRLEDGTDADDPLLSARQRYHAPLHAALDVAIAKAEEADAQRAATPVQRKKNNPPEAPK